MKQSLLMLVCLFSLKAAAEDIEIDVSVPETTTGQTWSVVGPKTLAPGANVVEGSVGYPSISAGYLRGVYSGVNLGVRAGFVYGVEGMLRDAAPGFKLQGLFKARLLDSGNISLGVTFEPGFFVHSSFFQGARGGLSLPLGARLGIAASSALCVAVSIELPMWVEFGTFGGFNLPILTGGGVEYFVSSSTVLFFRTRIGPTVRTMGRPTEVTFEAALGVGYRFN